MLGRVGRRADSAQGRHLLLTSADRSEPKTLHVHNRLWTALGAFLRPQLLLGAAYIGTCGVLPSIVPMPFTGADVLSRAVNRTYATAVVFSVTWSFSCVNNDNYFDWHYNDLHLVLRQCMVGMSIGACAFGTVALVAHTLGWVSFIGLGWQQARIGQVATTVFALALHHLSVASSEELIFRGYALNLLRSAMGLPVASTTLIALFALAHGFEPEPQRLIGMATGGLMYTMLLLASGSIWTSIGCHFAWNYMQTALLGPAQGQPSLLPMLNHGPELWLGKPGYPEPGLLSIIVNLAVAGSAAGVWWRSRHLPH